MMIPLKARLLDPHDLPRIRLDQEKVLWELFTKDKNPQIADINIVAAELSLAPYQVRVSLCCRSCTLTSVQDVLGRWHSIRSFWPLQLNSELHAPGTVSFLYDYLHTNSADSTEAKFLSCVGFSWSKISRQSLPHITLAESPTKALNPLSCDFLVHGHNFHWEAAHANSPRCIGSCSDHQNFQGMVSTSACFLATFARPSSQQQESLRHSTTGRNLTIIFYIPCVIGPLLACHAIPENQIRD